jgi:hypothetical protein
LSRKPQRSGLFNGWWLDMQGRRVERIKRDEYPELYRLHRICAEQERQGVGGAGTTAHAAIPIAASVSGRALRPQAVPHLERPGTTETSPFE